VGGFSTRGQHALISLVWVVLLAASCQPAKMARAWCIAGLAIGKCGRGGRQKVAGRIKRPFGYTGLSLS